MGADGRSARGRKPISLTGAHSSLLPGFGGNSALTALHYYPDPTGSSHGCVRVSAAMTRALAKLPVGTPIVFS
ncbi:L,D-transpeptidase [Frondihabitans sp. PAMC 28766]|uniref:L,D-transpeptidase n=1 Tax=Frondihabitans sp. PAMC 28766 TaxID=1795630 RepID=UPI003518BC07